MPLTASDIAAFSVEFQRLAIEFSAEAKRLRQANLPEQPSLEQVEERETWDRFVQKLPPMSRYYLEVTPQQRQKQRLEGNEGDSLFKCKPNVIQASRIVLKLLDHIHLKDLASLKVNAATLDLSDEKAVANFWWTDIVPTVARLDPPKPRVPSSQRMNRLEESALACNRISALLMDLVPVTSQRPDLTLKGLAEATEESEGTIRHAADAARVKRPGRGKHHQQFSDAEVYQIAVQRNKSSRLSKKTRDKWNQLLANIGSITLDAPLRAIRKNRTK